jgi:AraC-like DNA-binding protein
MARSGHSPVPALLARQYFTPQEPSLRVLYESRQPAVPEHRHEFFEIAIVRSGTGVHRTGCDRRTMGPGDVFVLNTQRAHSYETTRELSLVNILVRHQVMARLENSLGRLRAFRILFARENKYWRRYPYAGHLRLAGNDLDQSVDWIEQMKRETQRDAEAGTSLAEAYLTLLAGLLARRQGPEMAAPARISGVGLMCRALETELERPPSLPELARKAGLCGRTAERRFKRIFGTTPAAYGIRMRILRAAELLRLHADSLTISEVAARCGYDDSNYFSRSFRRATGLSPRAYRRAPQPPPVVMVEHRRSK